jgi:hypothetical protein
MAASDYVPISFKNRLHLAGRPQMSTRPSVLIGKSVTFWPSFKEAARWGRAELLRSNSTML